MDSQPCKTCSTVNAGYLRYCANCNADMLAVTEDEESEMFQSSFLDEEQAPSKTIDQVLMLIVSLITAFLGAVFYG